MSASAILKLQRVGFTSEQVEALADLVDSQAASKADLKTEVALLEVRLVRWVVGTGVASVLAMITVLKYILGPGH